MLFPLHFIPHKSWKDGGRDFGANRNGGRKHAGCDLLAPVGTPVRAITDGKILEFSSFYLSTFYITVSHNDFLIRYGEVQQSMAEGLRIGSLIKEGDVIGYVGQLQGLKFSMLHLEMYESVLEAPLTVKANKPFQRRADLLNPTLFLDELAQGLMTGSSSTGNRFFPQRYRL